MPLDARKTAHIQSVVPKTWAGRQRTVVFVYLASGVYSYVAETVIARPTQINDPEITDLVASASHTNVDMVIECALTIAFAGVVYVADTTTATSGAVASAAKYEVIEALPVGVIPGGTHIRALLRRLR